MYYITSSVIVPDLSLMKKEFQIVDKIEWYTRLLVEHCRKPRQLDGMPLPLYVLKKIHKNQDNIRTGGFPDLTDFSYCLANVACALHMNTNIDRNKLRRPTIFKNHTFEGTFLWCQSRARASLLDMIKEHMEVLSKLDKSQTEYGKIHIELASRDRRLKKMQKEIADESPSIKQKIQEYITFKSVDKLSEADKKEHNDLAVIIAKAADYNSNIQTTGKQMEMQVLRNIRDRIRTIQDNLRTVLNSCEKNDRTKLVEDAIESLCSLNNTKAFYDHFSQRYIYPDVKDHLVKLGYPVNLRKPILKDPEIKLLQQTPCNDLFAPLLQSPVKLKPGCKHLNGLINQRKEVEVKCSLWLMDKTIGFGWYRKHAIEKKTWGLFAAV